MNLDLNHNMRTDMYCPAYIDNMFSKDEVRQLHMLAESVPLERAQVGLGADHGLDSAVRRSNLKWIQPNAMPGWLQQRVIETFGAINSSHFKFHLSGAEAFQYTIYSATEHGEYKWHVDLAPVGAEIRKLSMSVLLSDPSEFEGGHLLVNPSGNTLVAEQRFGRAVFFPSWMPHCVTPVTKGVRKSLVIWAHGAPFV